MADSHSLLSDSRSLLSELSAAGGLLDETSSMIPMAGSFTSINSTRSGETTKSNDTNRFKIEFVRSVPMTSSVDTKLLSPVAMAVLESNALDNDHEDDDDGVTYYTNHNENKVCVTAEVHRADSLMSPAEENSDLPNILGADGGETGDCDIPSEGAGDPGMGETVGAHNGSIDGEDRDDPVRQIEVRNNGISSAQIQEGEDSLNIENSRHSVTNNSNNERGLPESGSVSGANVYTSRPYTGNTLTGSQGLPAIEKFDKNTAEENLADQETLDEFSQANELIRNDGTGLEQVCEGPGKSAEEDHSGVVDVQEGHNGSLDD
jgi:hypothetical protein